MDDISDRLEQTLAAFEEIADEITSDEAVDAIDGATLQLFWKQWPHISSWAGGLWKRLNDDLATPADFEVGSGE